MTVSWPQPPQRQLSATLSDGRVFAWSEWGPQDGQVVLFCTGAGMSGSLCFAPGPGIRLVAPDRPGLGRSSAHEGKNFATWVKDVESVPEFRDAVAVGFSQGAPFALALAHAGVARAVAVVAGQDELTHPAVQARLPVEVAAFVHALSTDPAFPAWFEASATSVGMLERIVDSSGSRDLEIYTDPRFSPHLRRAVEEGFAQGPAGYARDLVNAMQPWPFDLVEISQPVHLWYGALDESRVHSPDFGATLASRLPNATRYVEAGEGGSILWTRTGDILDALLAG